MPNKRDSALLNKIVSNMKIQTLIKQNRIQFVWMGGGKIYPTFINGKKYSTLKSEKENPFITHFRHLNDKEYHFIA